MRRLVLILLACGALGTSAWAQSTLANATISTSGADCSTATACADFDTRNVAAFGLYLDVGTSGTFHFEASVDATSLTTGTWFALSDDVTGTTSTTADGVKYFTNSGYRRFRVRASAISGNATVVAYRATLNVRAMPSLVPGTGATNLGKAEDAAAVSGDTGIAVLGVRKDTNAVATNADGDYAVPALDAYSALFVRRDHPNRFTCGADNIAATLTELSTACAATTVGASESLYITDIVAQSTTATAGQFILRSGTGTNCGTGTASVLPSAATVVRLGAPANTAGPAVMSFATPIKVTADHGLCVLGIATNTTTIQVSGFIAQ